MEFLTLLLFLLAVGLFILASWAGRKISELRYLALIVGVFSMVTALRDTTLGDAVTYLVILDVFMIMFAVTWMIFPDGGRDRWPRRNRRTISGRSPTF